MLRVMFIEFVLLFTVLRSIQVVYGLHNVTVYSQDSQIVYSSGDWTLTAASSLDAGGVHMLTDHSQATATFTFTGTVMITSRI